VKADLEEDLKQLRNSSSELERSLRELAEKARSRTEFFENISHELRTPLTPIIASSEALLGKTFGELTREQREMVEMLFLSARKLDLLIEDLIELVRLDSGIMKLDMESVDLAAIVDEGIHETALLAKDRHIDLRNELEGDVPFVRGDMKRLSQLLINLLHNAIKFSHEGGVVSVALDRSRVEHGLVGIRVTDRGIGIPAEAIERIFDRFFQAGNGEVGDGLGLGLAIVKKIADAHGGEVRVESEVGEGSSFTVFLPLSREHL
jgi:signal transduction histidine kinase